MYVNETTCCAYYRCGEPPVAKLAGFPYCEECLVIVLAGTGDRELVGEVKPLAGSKLETRCACNAALNLITAAKWRPRAALAARATAASLG